MLNGDTKQNYYFKMVHGAIESGLREAHKLLKDVRSAPFGQAVKKPQKCSVVIIGAGMAGLGAARELIAAGINDIVILEAQDKAGGRISTIPMGKSHIELGAQWIHGEDNPIYHIALKQNLLSNTTSVEGLGPYLKTDGTELCSSLVAHVSHKISCFLEECEEFVDCSENYPASVGQYLQNCFEEYLENCTDDSEEESALKWELFQWHLRFQEIDNSCTDLRNLSAKDWGKYKFTGGEDCINLMHGYSSVIEALLQDLPDKIVYFNSPVKKVTWKKSFDWSMLLSSSADNVRHCPVAVTCEDGSVIHASHVIATCSLGYLKANYRSMFEPSLPTCLSSAIDSMGFGVVDKIFLIYDEPWWSKDRLAFQIVQSHSEKNNENSESWWLKDFTGFDVLSRDPAVLLAWVGGDGAVHMEQLDEEVVGEHCTNLLKKCLKQENIPFPKQIKRSSWYSNPYIKGGYSHTTAACDKIGLGPVDLTRPVYCDTSDSLKHPVILLAGEAAHESHFSTTHGAFESGQSQARALVKYQKDVTQISTGNGGENIDHE